MKDEDVCPDCNVYLEMLEPTKEHPRLFECPVCHVKYWEISVFEELELELN